MCDVHQFIDEFGLHEHQPASLQQVAQAYEITLAPLSRHTMGAGILDGEQRLIIVNRSLSLAERRMVICHEAAHMLRDHSNTLHLLARNSWLFRREELEAQEAAARMLINRYWLEELEREGYSDAQIALILQVPPVLVHLRRRVGCVFPDLYPARPLAAAQAALSL